MSWKSTYTGSITNRPAWMVGGSGLSIGQSPAIKRWVQIQADGRSKDRHTIFMVNQLGGIGGGYKNSMFGPTADGVHSRQRGRIVSYLYCNAEGQNCCNCSSISECKTRTKLGECCAAYFATPREPISGTAYVIETAPKQYYIIGSKFAIFQALAIATGSCERAGAERVAGVRVYPKSCSDIYPSKFCDLQYVGVSANTIFWSLKPYSNPFTVTFQNFGVGIGTNPTNIQ